MSAINHSGKEAFSLLKLFKVDKDFGKINNDYFETQKEERLKELLEAHKKIEKAYSNGDRIMAMDKQRGEARI